MKAISRLMVLFLLLGLPVLTYPQGIRKNVEAILQQVLANQKQMQEDIAELKKRLTDKDREILELRNMIERQQALLQDQAQMIALRPSSATGTVDAYSARQQYEIARSMQHDVMFNVRRGQQAPLFEKVIQEFRKVVNLYPHSQEADDAQIRIARIYHRYLDRIDLAVQEYQLLLVNYPDSEFAAEAQKSLNAIQGIK